MPLTEVAGSTTPTADCVGLHVVYVVERPILRDVRYTVQRASSSSRYWVNGVGGVAVK